MKENEAVMQEEADLRERALSHPVLQMMLRAFEKADPEGTKRLRENIEASEPDDRMPAFLDALDEEHATYTATSTRIESPRPVTDEAWVEAVRNAIEQSLIGALPANRARKVAAGVEVGPGHQQISPLKLALAALAVPRPSPDTEERVRALRAALEPFAEVADINEECGREHPDDDRIWIVQAYGCQLAELSDGDFCRARDVLTLLKEDQTK